MTTAYEAAMAELDAINAAYIAGYNTGYAHGRNDRHADAGAVARHSAAAAVVSRLVDWPERDRDADRAAAQRRADRFGQPRFGGAA